VTLEMPEQICVECGIRLGALPEYRDLLARAAAEGTAPPTIDCPACHATNPVDLDAELPPAPTTTTPQGPTIPCPLCDGHVSHVDEDTPDAFWGCGHCGWVWRRKATLDLTRATVGRFNRLPCSASCRSTGHCVVNDDMPGCRTGPRSRPRPARTIGKILRQDRKTLLLSAN
jgi:hypothetical protein